MAETFNSFILLARYKPIISMLEDIRLALMDRMREKKKLLGKFVGGVAPRIQKKMKLAYEEQKNCQTHWNGLDESGFEVIHKGVSHTVDLSNRTCSCRQWDLTGIPCTHAVSVILFMRRLPEDHLANWYKSDNYTQCYDSLLSPVQGSRFWDMQDEGDVLPPNIVKRAIGRPKTARRRDSSEVPRNSFKASRKGAPHKCSHCKSTEHTRRNCPTAPPRESHTQVSQAQGEGTSQADGGDTQGRKRGRPKGSRNRIGRCLEEMPPNNAVIPAQALIAKRRKAPREAPDGGRGRGRHNGRGRGRGREGGLRMPEGYGIWQGEHGEAVFRDTNQSEPTVIQLTPTIPSQTSENNE